MNDSSTSPGDPIHLPVVSTGRLDAAAATRAPAGESRDVPAASTAAAPTNNPPAATPAQNADDPAFRKKLLEGRVIEAISQIYDPEIPVNIYELGLIYKVDVHDDNSVDVQMTLTAPACPVAGSLPGQVEQKIESIPEVTKATVELVWDPPWSRDRMSEAAQLQLGLM